MLQDKIDRLDFFYSVLNALPYTGKKRFEDVNVHYKKNFHIGVPNIKNELTTEYGKYADYSKPGSRQLPENIPVSEPKYLNQNPEIYNYYENQQNMQQFSSPPPVRDQIYNSNPNFNPNDEMPQNPSFKNYTKELFADPFIKNIRSNRNIFYTPQPKVIQYFEERPFTRRKNRKMQMPKEKEFETKQVEDEEFQANKMPLPEIENNSNIKKKLGNYNIVNRSENKTIQKEKFEQQQRNRNIENPEINFTPEENIAHYVRMQKEKQNALKLKEKDSINYESKLKNLSKNDYLKLDWNRYLYRKVL